MSTHIDTRKKLQNIPRISSLMELLDSCTLSDEDKEIIKMHYVQNKTLSYIADILGYSESTIKKKHKKILSKLNKLL
jgi:RNA polymerase sigma factor (sigma-70 family)